MKTVRRDMLQRADHIYTGCNGLYYHHGIYVGKAKVTNPNNNEEQQEIEDAVIHFLVSGKKTDYKPQCRRCFYMPQLEGIVITCLDCFLEGQSLYVYKYDVSYWKLKFKRSGTCSTHCPNPPYMVIQTAFAVLEKKIDFGEYNFLFNNCEDFATYCKTGKAMSNQAAGVLFGFGLPGVIVYNIIKDVFYRDI